MLAEPISTLDNIILGHPQFHKKWSWLPEFLRPLDRKKILCELIELCKQNNFEIDFSKKIQEQSVGIQQRIEIIKLLYHQSDILILDEPTAVLTPNEISELFINLKKLKSIGKTVLIITHKLKEVMHVCDEVTVFRQGKVTGYQKVSEINVDRLAELMIGQKPNRSLNDSKVIIENKAPSLKVNNLSLIIKNRKILNNINFDIKPGEIIGIAGVEGNGQSELLSALAHPNTKNIFGEIHFFNNNVTFFKNKKRRSLGASYLPEDRILQGLIPNLSIWENFLLGHESDSELNSNYLLNLDKIKKITQNEVTNYNIQPNNINVAIKNLSGGNQQKLVVARELWKKPKILIAAQPTRGVDIGAVEFIHQQILQCKQNGSAILLVSSELDEVTALSDRILVMYKGQIVAQFLKNEFDEKSIGFAMTGLFNKGAAYA